MQSSNFGYGQWSNRLIQMLLGDSGQYWWGWRHFIGLCRILGNMYLTSNISRKEHWDDSDDLQICIADSLLLDQAAAACAEVNCL